MAVESGVRSRVLFAAESTENAREGVMWYELAALFPSLACCLGQHDEQSPREFEHGAMYLRCDRCGKRTAGWTLDYPRPVPHVAPAHRRASMRQAVSR
jgi:hypothetical protein